MQLKTKTEKKLVGRFIKNNFKRQIKQSLELKKY